MFGPDHDRSGFGEVAQCRYGHQTHRARADHRDRVAVANAGTQRGMDASGHRLNQHGGLVAHLFGHVMELAVVGDELGSPAPAGALAESCLQPGFEVAAGEVPVVVAVSGSGTLEGQRKPPRGVAQHRLDQNTAAVGGLAHDLMSQHEREGDEILEVA